MAVSLLDWWNEDTRLMEARHHLGKLWKGLPSLLIEETSWNRQLPILVGDEDDWWKDTPSL